MLYRISFLVQPGPGIEMCLSSPGIYNINNILSCRFKQCCMSFQLCRIPGIEMYFSASGIFNMITAPFNNMKDS